jgi:hypothetical protein
VFVLLGYVCIEGDDGFVPVLEFRAYCDPLCLLVPRVEVFEVYILLLHLGEVVEVEDV